jgi:hypothetical protein
MKPRPMNHKKINTMNPNQAARGALALTCIAIAAILGCASAQAQAPAQQHEFEPQDKAGYDVKTYQGDGQMVDKGKSAAADRFILNLGEIDFSKKKTYSFTLGNLPEVSLGAAFEIRDLPPLHPGDDTVKKDFNRASVHLLLKTVEGETIFEETAPLSEWTWGGTVGDTERIIWTPQTKFTGKPRQQYVLTLKISPLSGSKDIKPASVRISGGGWKVTP